MADGGVRLLFRRVRSLLWTAISIIVISAAVLVGVGKLLMPFSAHYKPRLEAWLSDEFQRPVSLASFEGEWKAFGPRISLRGMTLDAKGESQSQVAIEEAAVDIRPLNALIPGQPLYQFRIIGAHFELFHRLDGRWELSGLGVSAPESGKSGSALRQLSQVGDVMLQGSSLRLVDEKLGIDLRFSSIGGRLQTDGEVIAAEVRANLEDSGGHAASGELETVFRLLLDDEQRMADASWQMTGRELMVSALRDRMPASDVMPVQGRLNTELWGNWTAETGHTIRGATDLRDAVLLMGASEVRLERINTRLMLDLDSKTRWRLDLAEFRFDDRDNPWFAPRISVARDADEGVGMWIGADELPLGFPIDVTRTLVVERDLKWPRFLPRRAGGTVRDLDVVLNEKWKVVMARGEVSDASVAEWERGPDLSGFRASVDLGDRFGTIRFHSPAMDVRWPSLFRDPLTLAMPGCSMDLKWGGAWQLGFADCSVHNEDLAAHGEVRVTKSEGRPTVDVNVNIPRAQVDRLQPYWPERIIKPKMQAWLRRNLRSGTVTRGRFQIRGDLDDWPFRDGQGRFEALAEVRDGALDYVDGWPTARAVDATIRFDGPAMTVDGSVGDIGGLPADMARASIPDLKQPELTLTFAADTQLPSLLDFLQSSPINRDIDADLSRFEFSGPAAASGTLTVPLGTTPGELGVAGRVRLDGGGFFDPDADILIESIDGILDYDRKGFHGEALEVIYKGKPGLVDIEAGRKEAHSFRAEMTGRFDVQDVIPEFLTESYDALAGIRGQTDWTMTMTVLPPDEGVAAAAVNENSVKGVALLQIRSDLLDVPLQLPAPLQKGAHEPFDIALDYPLTGPNRVLELTLADRGVLKFDLGGQADSPTRILIHLGTVPGDLPRPGQIAIRGDGGALDLDGWIDLIVDGATRGQSLGGLELVEGRIRVDQLMFLDRPFPDVDVGFESIDHVLNATFLGDGIDGKVSYLSNESGPSTLNAEFDRLALGDPLSEGVNMQSDPADLPALHLYARSFQYSGIELGETRVEAYPTQEGFHFEKVDSTSDLLRVTAKGDWSLQDGFQRSDFRILMTSESLGSFLESMDISSSMEGGQTQVEFDAWWMGPPSAFALSRLNGDIAFNVSQGVISNASAGSGRLLGLLSVQALPKRLALDFRDVFDTGFAFDEASGTFVMQNGTARTDDVLLKSSSANILLTGSTDLVEQRYDQLMTVKPGVGNTLPLIGAIAGGPGGAAAGLALQGLLQKQLGEAMQVQYTITGPWEEPSIDPVTDIVDGG